MRLFHLLSVGILVAALPLQALAASVNHGRVSLASGQLHSYKTDLIYPGETRRTRIDSFELSLSEPLVPLWDGHLSLGYVDITQDTNPLTAGQSTAGPFIGIGARGRVLEAGPFSLVVDADYRYVLSDAQDGDQKVELRWHQLDATARLNWRLGAVPTLFVGGGVHYLDGEEVARGPVDQVLEFEYETDYSARLGMDFQVDRGGHIGVEVHSGVADGGRIYFLRRF